MSRIGKKPVIVPQGLTATMSQNVGGQQEIKISGPKGELTLNIHREIKMVISDGEILVAPESKLSKRGRGLWGLYKVLVENMVEGVSKGFEKKLEIEGVGFKASVDGEDLILNLGFTNPVRINKVDGIKFTVEKNVVIVAGIDKEKVGSMAALIRRQKKAEPYKGKGIKYQGEKIRRKQGKKVVAGK